MEKGNLTAENAKNILKNQRDFVMAGKPSVISVGEVNKAKAQASIIAVNRAEGGKDWAGQLKYIAPERSHNIVDMAVNDGDYHSGDKGAKVEDMVLEEVLKNNLRA